MKRSSLIAIISLLFATAAGAQSIKLDYFTTVPAAIKNCGAMYTYDSIGLEKKKYILLVDLQNKGMIKIAGKQINLLLTDTKTTGTLNTLIYKGGGYTVILSSTTGNHVGDYDMEEGSLQVIKGAKKLSLKIHGQSGCDVSKQEGNSR